MRKLRIIAAFLLIIGLLVLPIYWFTDTSFTGVVGHTALCLGNGILLYCALLDKKVDD